MHIRYIGHAGIAIDVAGRHLVCDPWWNGPAFAGQWHPFPPPQPEPIDITGLDILCLSHGHEDHMHVPTLRLLRRDALVVLPRLRDPGLGDFVRSLGFERVRELSHGVRTEISPRLFVTAYILRDDSVFVFEGDGRTVVNANDALHQAPDAVLQDLCANLRARHPRVDTLIAQCGHGGWMSDRVQVIDDVAAGTDAARRALHDRFAALAHRLGARIALPLEPSYLCLDRTNRDERVPRMDAALLRETLHRLGAGDVVVHVMAPGDRLVEEQLRAGGHRRATAESVAAALRTDFAVAMAERRHHRELDPARMERLVAALAANARARAGRVLGSGASLHCRIDLRDVPEWSIWVVVDDDDIQVTRTDRLRLAPMVLTTRLEVLEALALRDYGDESIRFGGGATLGIRRRDLALAEPLIALLGRRPLQHSRSEALLAWIRDPRRAFESWRRERHLQTLVYSTRHVDLPQHRPEARARANVS